MKCALISIATLLLAATSASAADPSAKFGGYIEGQFGLVMIQKQDSFDRDTETKFKTKYDDSISFGGEVGMNLTENLRLGLGTQFFDAKVDSNVRSDEDGETTLTGEDLENVPDKRVAVYTVNGYYDFNKGQQLMPFIGAGIGIADIQLAQDRKFASSVSLGVRYHVRNSMFIGAKWTTVFVDEFRDLLDEATKYDNLTAHNAGITLGVAF
jgi:opacity protein-like surface antigen